MKAGRWKRSRNDGRKVGRQLRKWDDKLKQFQGVGQLVTDIIP
jgi:hypothetical protein